MFVILKKKIHFKWNQSGKTFSLDALNIFLYKRTGIHGGILIVKRTIRSLWPLYDGNHNAPQLK